MNIAHYFTLSRVFISPLFPIFYLGHSWLGIPPISVPYLLLTLLLFCEFSDIFDGFWARKKNQVTDLGKVLDPMADSITHISLFLTFTKGAVSLPLLLVLVFLYRDFFISTLRTLCALKGVALGARFSGKMKTVMQAVSSFAIIALMIPYAHGLLSIDLFQQISLCLVAVSAFYTVFSMGDYVISNRIYIRQALQ